MIHAWDSPKVSPWHDPGKGEQPWRGVLRQKHGAGEKASAAMTENKTDENKAQEPTEQEWKALEQELLARDQAKTKAFVDRMIEKLGVARALEVCGDIADHLNKRHG